ncbi:MAG: hypothetical protein WBB19_17330, partial [Desulforhopalus sp.]
DVEQKKLEKKYTPPPKAVMAWAEWQDTKNKAEVLRQLLDLGYELTERTFYRHCKQGKCRTNEEGYYSRRIVKEGYIDAQGITRVGQPAEENGPDVALSVEKQRLENRKLELSNARDELKHKKEQGLLIERPGLYLEIAAREVALDGMYRQMVDMEGSKMITMVNGDMSHLPEFKEYLFTLWEEMLRTFSNTDEFEVLFEEEEDKN